MQTTADRVVIGRIGKPYGIQGWVKVQSFTDPVENILEYVPWQIYQTGEWVVIDLVEGRKHGDTIVAHLANCQNPEQASGYTGKEIAILRKQLPSLQKDEYYWTDLEGLNVVTSTGIALGTVNYLFKSGANDILVVKGDKDRLIPFTLGQTVVKVDLESKIIEVDWDPEF